MIETTRHDIAEAVLRKITDDLYSEPSVRTLEVFAAEFSRRVAASGFELPDDPRIHASMASIATSFFRARHHGSPTVPHP